jgi:WD40 repeat protein
MSGFDLFLSYHGADREPAMELARVLKARGISTFLDRHQLLPGRSWPEELEKGLAECRAVAVLIGPHGMGAWQKREMYFALDRQIRDQEDHGRDFPVVPVLLPDVRDLKAGFLFLNTWVDLRAGVLAEEGLESLLRAVQGEAAAQESQVEGLFPYLGLQFFSEEDAAFFLGREKEAEELLQLVLHPNLVTLVGSSGSGKSSLAQAGLLPLLRRQRPPNDVWDAVWLSPGNNPLRALADALVPLLYPDLLDKISIQDKGGDLARVFAKGPEEVEVTLRNCLKNWRTDRLLVIVDPLEELFTQAREGQGQDFLKALLQAQERLPLTLLFTLRADFYDLATGFDQDFGKRILSGQMNLGPMKGENLRRAITEPARRARQELPPDLVERILEDAGEEPGILPLVEFTLQALWEKGLTHAAYQEIGEVAGAIAKSADAVVGAFPPEELTAVRRVFTQLVRFEAEGRRLRQRIPFDAMSALEQRIARELATEKGKRLLVLEGETKAETVTLAHEAILRHWKTLQTWLDEDQELLLWRQGLQDTLARWENAHRDEGALLRGALLIEAERRLAERPAELSPEQQQFIQESTALRKRLRRRTLGALLTTVGAIILSLIAVSIFWRIAVRERNRQQARALGYQANVQFANGHQKALLLAIEAFQRTRDADQPRFPPIEQALRQALTAFGGRILGSYRGLNQRVIASPDRTWIAALAADGKIWTWNLNAADPVKAEEVFAGLQGVLDHFEISPKNGWLLASTRDDPTQFLLQGLEGQQGPPLPFRSPLLLAAFSPDDHWLALLLRDEGVHLIDLAAPSPHDVHLSIDTEVRSLAFSPDGDRMALGGDDGIVRLFTLNGGPGGLLTSPAAGAAVTALRFIPNTDALVALDLSGKIRQWAWRGEAGGWRDLGVAGSLGARDLQVSAGGRWFVAWTPLTRVADLWDLTSRQHIAVRGGVTALTLLDHKLAVGTELGQSTWTDLDKPWSGDLKRKIGAVRALATSLKGHWLMAGGDDRFASLRKLGEETSPRLSQELMLGGHDDPVEVLGIGADEHWLVTSGSAGQPPRLWDLRGNDPMAPAEPSLSTAPDLACPSQVLAKIAAELTVEKKWAASADCHWLAVGLPASREGYAEVHLLDLRDPGHSIPLRRSHGQGVGALAFSPDGHLLVTGGKDGVLHLWRDAAVSAKLLVLKPERGPEITAATFSRDGGWLAVAAEDRVVRVWDHPEKLGRGDSPARRLEGPAEPVTSLAFGPGSWIAAGGREGTVYLWDQDSRTPIAVKKHSGAVRAISFSKDGSYLLSTDDAGITLRWRMDEKELEGFACQTVGRNLSRQEWADFFPSGETYHRTCPDLPPG